MGVCVQIHLNELAYRQRNERYVLMHIIMFAVWLSVCFCVEHAQTVIINFQQDNKDYIYGHQQAVRLVIWILCYNLFHKTSLLYKKNYYCIRSAIHGTELSGVDPVCTVRFWNVTSPQTVLIFVLEKIKNEADIIHTHIHDTWYNTYKFHNIKDSRLWVLLIHV